MRDKPSGKNGGTTDIRQYCGVAILARTGAAHRCDDPSDISDVRERIRQLTCIASGAGLPQISLPLGELEGCPLGLSLIGPKGGSDETLLGMARNTAAIAECCSHEARAHGGYCSLPLPLNISRCSVLFLGFEQQGWQPGGDLGEHLATDISPTT